MTSRRLRHGLIIGLVLPALLWRAAIPAGFMPVFDAQGRLSLGFCPGVVVAPAATSGSSAEHAHHHHGAAGAPGDSGSTPVTHDSLCPFALSAGPALGAAFAAAPAPQVLAADLKRGALVLVHTSTIERAQTARGPPAPQAI